VSSTDSSLRLTRRPGIVRFRLPHTAGALLFPLAAAVLVAMVVLPLGWLVWMSFHSDDTGLATLRNYVDVFRSHAGQQAIVNSLILALAVALAATVAGTLLAWLTARTDMPLRGLVRALILAGFVTPSFLGALAWTLLASPNAGWLNEAWRALSGSGRPLFDIFSLGGAIFVMSIYALSYPYSLVAAALEQAPAEYENAARTLGAGLTRITRSITLPLALPAILSGFILAFLETIGSFGVPAFLLIPARVPVITIHLYAFFSAFPPGVGEAAAYGIPLLLATAVLLIVQRRLLGRASYTLITGKAGTLRRVPLGRWRWPAFAVAMVAPLLAVLLPYSAMFVVSLLKVWGKGLFAPHNYSLRWYALALFHGDAAGVALRHSLLYCSAAATIAVVVATLAAYGRVRRLLPGGVVLGFIALAPFAVPGMVLAIGFYAAYSHPPIRLVGTAWVLIIAFATQFLPIAYTNGISMFGALNLDLENAGRILGASRLRVLWSINAPLLRGFLVSSWLLIFITSFRELSTVIFLYVGQTSVITTAIFDYSASGPYQPLFVLGILMMLVVFVASAVLHRVFGARPRLSGSGI
jgi:iron(III) transport system permease protein